MVILQEKKKNQKIEALIGSELSSAGLKKWTLNKTENLACVCLLLCSKHFDTNIYINNWNFIYVFTVLQLNTAAIPTSPARGWMLNWTQITRIILTITFPLQCSYIKRLNNLQPLHIFPAASYVLCCVWYGWALCPNRSWVLRRTDQTNVIQWQTADLLWRWVSIITPVWRGG